MNNKTIPQIICDILGEMGDMTFMPEVWREGCGAVFLTGEISDGDEFTDASVGFEVAVRCGDTSSDRADALVLLAMADGYLRARAVTLGGTAGYVVPVKGARQVNVQKNGEAEYRAEYLLKYAQVTAGTASVRRYYIGTADGWSDVGEGFFRFDEDLQPNIYERRYFHENVTEADVCGYSPEISYEADIRSSSPGAEMLWKISISEAVGEGAAVDVVTVLYSCESDTPGAYSAYKRSYSVVPAGQSKNDGCLCHTGKLLARGKREAGRFVASTKTFVADSMNI